mgnify:CR=1 FL=1
MRPNRGAVATSVVVLLLVVGVLTLMAHMRVQKTMPEDGAVLSGAPSRIQVWYTQSPDPAISPAYLPEQPQRERKGLESVHERLIRQSFTHRGATPPT